MQRIIILVVDHGSLLNRRSFDDLDLSKIQFQPFFMVKRGRMTLCFVMKSWNSERIVSVSDFRFCWIRELFEFVAESSKEFNLSRNNSIAHVDIIVR